MSTILPSTTQVEDFEEAPRHRFFIMSLAFWHVLRRDTVVAARSFIPFLFQALVMPFALLFIFGRILPGVGVTQQMYPALFLPGVVAVTIFMASLQGVSLSLMLDLDGNHEIEDRLLAPLTVGLVALGKIVFSAFRSLVAGGLTFLEAYLILGSRYQVRTDSLVLLIVILVLYALSSSSLGLVLGSALSADKIYLLFTLIFSATLYTGCVYYSWDEISSLRVLQVITLFNPLSYAAEALRYAMVPLVHGQMVPTLPIAWSLLALVASFLGFLALGIRVFRKRVIA